MNINFIVCHFGIICEHGSVGFGREGESEEEGEGEPSNPHLHASLRCSSCRVRPKNLMSC